jgi:hypothetical protein
MTKNTENKDQIPEKAPVWFTVAIDGLNGRMDRLDGRMDKLETGLNGRMDSLDGRVCKIYLV